MVRKASSNPTDAELEHWAEELESRIARLEAERVALESSLATVEDATDLIGVTAGVNAKVETINGTLTVDDAVVATLGEVLSAGWLLLSPLRSLRDQPEAE